jgi:hypothetical protein
MKQKASPIIAIVVAVIAAILGFMYLKKSTEPELPNYTPGVPPWMEKGGTANPRPNEGSSEQTPGNTAPGAGPVAPSRSGSN